MFKLANFQINTRTAASEWVAVIMAMEQSLALLRAEPGSLTKLYRYLHDRTGGSICALSDLIREAAIEAITTGAETLTKPLLDGIIISQHAQAGYANTLRRRGKRAAAKASTAMGSGESVA